MNFLKYLLKRIRLFLIEYKNFKKLYKPGINIEHGARFENVDNISIGVKSFVRKNAVIWGDKNCELIIGQKVYVNSYCFLQGDIEIGNHVMLAPFVSIFGGSHKFSDKKVPMDSQGYTRQGIKIEDDVWIGSHAVILDGAVIKKGAIIAAGSVVKGTVEEYEIVAGIPAERIKKR